MLKNLILVSTLLLSYFSFAMGHLDHEKGLHPVAKSGQMIVTYQGDCSKGNAKKAMQLIDKIITYERKTVRLNIHQHLELGLIIPLEQLICMTLKML